MKQKFLIGLLLFSIGGVFFWRSKLITAVPSPALFSETKLKEYKLKLLPSASIPARTILASLEKIKSVITPLDVFFQIVADVLRDKKISINDRLSIAVELMADMDEDPRRRFIDLLSAISDIKFSIADFVEELEEKIEPTATGKLAKINTIKKLSEEQLKDASFFDFVKNKGIARVKKLLEQSKHLANVVDMYGNTPLMLAAQNVDFPMVQLLVEKGAKVDAQNKKGTSALMYLASVVGLDTPEGKKIYLYLLDEGAEEALQDRGGRTFVDYANDRFRKRR